jgi:tight adherence protein C
VSAGLLTGACLGLGLLLVIAGMRPAAPTLARSLATLDAAARSRPASDQVARGRTGRLAALRRRAAVELAAGLDRRGWVPATQAADLAVLGRDRGELGTAKLTGAAIGLAVFPILLAAAGLLGLPGAAVLALPGWLAATTGIVGFLLPDAALRRRAAGRRRDFRAAVGGYLDLVAMRMASGAGLAEALTDAAGIGTGPAFARLRTALADARTDGLTPAAALSRLGTELALPELVDTGTRLALVDASGAQAEQSLRASAAALRDRERTDAHGTANERSQSMLVAQVVLGLGFLVFLGYPAVAKILAT